MRRVVAAGATEQVKRMIDDGPSRRSRRAARSSTQPGSRWSSSRRPMPHRLGLEARITTAPPVRRVYAQIKGRGTGRGRQRISINCRTVWNSTSASRERWLGRGRASLTCRPRSAPVANKEHAPSDGCLRGAATSCSIRHLVDRAHHKIRCSTSVHNKRAYHQSNVLAGDGRGTAAA